MSLRIPRELLRRLHAGVVRADELFPYDGARWRHESYRRDRDLTSAIRHSVVWYFQRTAERLGPERELEYLRKFEYGNADMSGSLTSFWLYCRPDVRWLVGHVRRGSRAWIFVSNVVADRLAPLAAVDLAARSLKRAGVL